MGFENQLIKNFQPVELGYDQRSLNLYDNKDWSIAQHYTGLINTEVKILICLLLDKEKFMKTTPEHKS
jgi:hypothetical protein